MTWAAEAFCFAGEVVNHPAAVSPLWVEGERRGSVPGSRLRSGAVSPLWVGGVGLPPSPPLGCCVGDGACPPHGIPNTFYRRVKELGL